MICLGFRVWKVGFKNLKVTICLEFNQDTKKQTRKRLKINKYSKLRIIDLENRHKIDFLTNLTPAMSLTVKNAMKIYRVRLEIEE